jgi:hypothetical protein
MFLRLPSQKCITNRFPFCRACFQKERLRNSALYFHGGTDVVEFSSAANRAKCEKECSMDGIALRLAKKLFDQRLIQNQFRSAYVKEMIEPYLSLEGWRVVYGGASGWDFERGEDRIVVKQSAALQAWPEVRSVRTRGIFDIAVREDGSGSEPIQGRRTQTYVFAWHPVCGDEADHRDSSQWEFYVISASALPDGQRTISLSKIRGLEDPAKLETLALRCCRTASDQIRQDTALLDFNPISQARE